MLITPVRRALRAAGARRHRRHAAQGRVRRYVATGRYSPVLGVALPPRHHARAARGRRHRPHPLAPTPPRSRSARKDIPAVHYMIAAAGGPTIRCGGYATYGTEELSDARLEGAGGPHLLPARQSRHDRDRRQTLGQGACGWRSSSRPSRKQYYLTLAHRRAGGPARRRDRRVVRSSSRATGRQRRKAAARQAQNEAASAASRKKTSVHEAWPMASTLSAG